MANDKIKILYEENDIDGLVAILIHDRDWFMRLEAAEALARLKDPRGIDYLVVSLKDLDPEVSGVAKEILTELDNPRGNQVLKDLEQKAMRPCPHCHQEHPVNASFCPITGEKIHSLKFCPYCGTSIEPGWRICGECGNVLQPGTSIPSRKKTHSPNSSSKTKWVNWAVGGTIILAIFILAVILFNGYANEPNNGRTTSNETFFSPSQVDIIGRWYFEPISSGWQPGWMEFYEDGSYYDNGHNSRTYVLLSDGRLKLTANIGGGVELFDVDITGDRMMITDEYGDQAIGTRSR